MMRRIVHFLFLFGIGILIGVAFFYPTKERGALKPDVSSAFNRDLRHHGLRRTSEGDELEVATYTNKSSGLDLHIWRSRHKGDYLLALQRQFHAERSISLVYGTLEEHPPLGLQERAKVADGTNNVSWLRSWLHSAYAHRLSRRNNEDPSRILANRLSIFSLNYTRSKQPRGKAKAEEGTHMHVLRIFL